MPSADFCMRIPTPLDVGSTRHACRSPRVLRTHLHAYACRIYVVAFRTSMGFDDIGHLTPLRRLISASCSSGQRFAFGFLQISSRPEHPCRSANSSPCRASRGLSPPSKCALPGAPIKKPHVSMGLLTAEEPRFYQRRAQDLRRRSEVARPTRPRPISASEPGSGTDRRY